MRNNEVIYKFSISSKNGFIFFTFDSQFEVPVVIYLFSKFAMPEGKQNS
jgi:hypothetical protein